MNLQPMDKKMADYSPDERIVSTALPAQGRLGGGWRNWLLMLVLVSSAPCMALIFTALGPVMPGIAAHFGQGRDGALVAQMVMTMPSIGIILGGPVTGWLVERSGARRVLFGALACYSVVGCAGMLIDGAYVLLATRLALGLSAAGIATSTLALIGERFDGETRGRILGYQNAAGSAFGLVSLLLAGAIGEAEGWRGPFALYLLGAAVLAIGAATLPASAPSAAGAREKRDERGGHVWSLWPVYLLLVLIYMAVFMNAVQLSFLLAADKVTSPQTQSMVLAAGSVASMVGAALFGTMLARLGARATFFGCLALMACGYGIVGASHEVMLTMAGSALAGLGGGCVGPYLASMLLQRAAPEVRGRAAGFMYSAVFLGDFINPLVITPLRTGLGIHHAFLAVAGVLAVGAVVVLLRPASKSA
jgi:MFS family permease